MERLKINYADLYQARKHAKELLKELTRLKWACIVFYLLIENPKKTLEEIKKGIKQVRHYLETIDNMFLNHVDTIQFQTAPNYPVI